MALSKSHLPCLVLVEPRKRWTDDRLGQTLNLNSLLVKRQIDNPSPGAVTGGNKSLALTREVNCDEAGDYVVPYVLSPRDLVFRPDNMNETVPHT